MAVNHGIKHGVKYYSPVDFTIRVSSHSPVLLVYCGSIRRNRGHAGHKLTRTVRMVIIMRRVIIGIKVGRRVSKRAGCLY